MLGTPTSRCVLSLTFLPCDIRLMQERTDNTFQSRSCVSLSVPTHRYKISCILVAVGVKDQNYQTMSEIFDADWALFFRRLFVWVQNLNYFLAQSNSIAWRVGTCIGVTIRQLPTGAFSQASCPCYQWIQLCWTKMPSSRVFHRIFVVCLF